MSDGPRTPGKGAAAGDSPELLDLCRKLQLASQLHMARLAQDQEDLVARFLGRAPREALLGPRVPPRSPLFAPLAAAAASPAAEPAHPDAPGAREGQPDPWGPAAGSAGTPAAESARAAPTERRQEVGSPAVPRLRPQSSVKMQLSGLETDWAEFAEEGILSNLDDVVARVPVASAQLSWVAKRVKSVRETQEPRPTGRLAEFVLSSAFNYTCILAIAFNSVVIWYSTNADFEGVWRHRGEDYFEETTLKNIEMGFVCFYSVEIVLKMLAHRLYFFINEEWTWNVFDVFLVVISLGEQALVLFGTVGVNLSFLRMLRILKVVKVLRLVRTLRYFKDLRLMLNMIVRSVSALFWCLIMLMFVLYIWSVLLMQLLSLYLEDAVAGQPRAGVEEMREAYQPHFGSVRRTCISLFSATSGGQDWMDLFDLLEPGGQALIYVFLTYILFFVLVAWNIVTGTFVEKAFRLSQPDLETVMMDQARENHLAAVELKELFAKADMDHSKSLNRQEFKSLMAQDSFRRCLEARGININDIEVFFSILQSAGGEEQDQLDVSTLVNACLRMKGVATSIDLHALRFESKLLDMKMAKMSGTLDRLEAAMEMRRLVDEGVMGGLPRAGHDDESFAC